MVEGVLDGVFHDAARFRAGEAILGLPLKFRLADEHRDHAGGACHDVVAAHRRCTFSLPEALRMNLIPFSSALRSPASCVPPSGVGIVLQ